MFLSVFMISKDLKYRLAFLSITGIGPKGMKKIHECFGSYENAWNSKKDEYIKKGFSYNISIEIYKSIQKIDPDKLLSQEISNGVSLLIPEDKDYPFLLKQITAPPPILWCKGNTNILNQTCLSVVGTRKPSPYACGTVKRLISNLPSGITIVSGLALGIDALVHKVALENNLPTVAVLGSGVNCISPLTNLEIGHEIIESNGCIVSELPSNTTAQREFFPRRNRIIAGLSKATLIIEAGIKSGALITASHALDEGRNVLTVPGNILNDNALGSNHLLRLGAIPALDTKDILCSLDIS